MLALLGLSAIGGVALAGVNLYRALAAVRVLVSVGAVGARALSGIQYETQGSRRAVLQLLWAENSAVQSAHIAEARGADDRITGRLQELMGLRNSPCRIMQQFLGNYYASWKGSQSGRGN